MTTNKMLNKVIHKLFDWAWKPEQVKLTKIKEEDIETLNPYGKHLSSNSEPLFIKAFVNEEIFEKGILITMTFNDKAIFSKFIPK